MDHMLRSGDQAIFDPLFGAAIVTAPPGIITGSGRAKLDGATVCVEGDESTVVVTATYVTAVLSTAGTCVVTIESLGADQSALKAKSSRLATLLRGSSFRARLQVTSPATSPNASDAPGAVYSGTGVFVTANVKVRAL
ncbi:MAG: hypothetical protein IAG13_01325 [Deltaproteobacteria bacterium]|nr:hypothetical protein [Nannocystaceae bacterium]